MALKRGLDGKFAMLRKLTFSIQRASQPFPSWVILHSEDLHALILLYTEVQFSSSMPVMPDSCCMKNLHLPLQLRKDRNRVRKLTINSNKWDLDGVEWAESKNLYALGCAKLLNIMKGTQTKL